MSKFNLTNEDYEIMKEMYDLTGKSILNSEELKQIEEIQIKYDDIVKRMGDGRVTKGYTFSDEEIRFIYQHGRLVYTLYKNK